jgi:arylsulfatase A-like enzyme
MNKTHFSPLPHQENRPPNVLFVLADDLGWGDLSMHGSEIQTPTIDRLGDEGVELTQHYVCPVCTPTRTCLLSGRHPGRFGDHCTTPTNKPVLPDGYTTLAGMFKTAGYDTGLFGKWHLGSDIKFAPSHYGFDHSYGSLAGGVDPYSHCYKRGPYMKTWHRNGELLDEYGHVSDLVADEAARWILDRPLGTPWFAYVPFTAVHIPVRAPQHWLDRYWNHYYDEDPLRDASFKRYAAYTSHMDACLGRVIDAVAQRSEMRNTIIIFCSDNGAMESIGIEALNKYPGYHEECPRLGSNLPWRGRKGTLYEGGIRTPMIVHWHGELQPAKVETPVHMVDWMPTFQNLVGGKTPEDPQYDGTDIWDVVSGKTAHAPDRPIYWKYHNSHYGLMLENLKLVARDLGGPEMQCELYNIREDPYEKRDLAGDLPGKVKSMLDEIDKQRELDDTSVRPDLDEWSWI